MTSSTSSSERPSRPRWAIGLGLLVFSCVVGLPMWALWTLRAAPQSFILEIDQELVVNRPTFLLLGNSIAREAIDKPLLTRGLGLEEGKAYPMLIGGSSPGIGIPL